MAQGGTYEPPHRRRGKRKPMGVRPATVRNHQPRHFFAHELDTR